MSLGGLGRPDRGGGKDFKKERGKRGHSKDRQTDRQCGQWLADERVDCVLRDEGEGAASLRVMSWIKALTAGTALPFVLRAKGATDELEAGASVQQGGDVDMIWGQ